MVSVISKKLTEVAGLMPVMSHVRTPKLSMSSLDESQSDVGFPVQILKMSSMNLLK